MRSHRQKAQDAQNEALILERTLVLTTLRKGAVEKGSLRIRSAHAGLNNLRDTAIDSLVAEGKIELGEGDVYRIKEGQS
jgi:hypothetical protein